MNTYMSIPGNIAKLGAIHSNLQTAKSNPYLVGSEFNALVSTLLSQQRHMTSEWHIISVTSIHYLGMGWNIHLSRSLILVVIDVVDIDCSSRIISKLFNNLRCRAPALEVLNTYNNNCNFPSQNHNKTVKNVSTIIKNIFSQ